METGHLLRHMFLYFCSSTVNNFLFIWPECSYLQLVPIVFFHSACQRRGCLCCHEGMVLAQIQPAVHPDSKWFSSELCHLACFSPTCTDSQGCTILGAGFHVCLFISIFYYYSLYKYTIYLLFYGGKG